MDVQKMTLLDLIERSEKATPDAPALVAAGGITTYRQLLADSRKLAAALLKETSSPVVALFYPMMPEFVTAYFGALYAGKVALPLNLLLPPEELKYILTDSGADLIVAPPVLASRLQPLGVKVFSAAPTADAGGGVLPRPMPDDLCTLLYTSGTTGRPKGVELTHWNLASNASRAVDAMRLTPEHRLLACLPTFHSMAITGSIVAPLAAGGSLGTLGKFDPEAVLKVASELKCNVLMMVPSMYRLVTRMQERKPYDLKHLKLAIAGAEALPSEVRESFEKTFGIPLLEGYGQTESSPVISFNMPWANSPGTAGKPIRDVQVRIVDPDALSDMPAQQTGEIWVKGPNVMKGYHNRPEETAKTLTAGGWLRTGDMGQLTPDGYIRITGRLREMIKVAGEMVFPAEVEAVLLQHAAVLEAGVAGSKDERKGEIVKAYVVLKPGENASADDLLAHCRSALAAYKLPKGIEFRAELPKGPTGKVLRRFLK